MAAVRMIGEPQQDFEASVRRTPRTLPGRFPVMGVGPISQRAFNISVEPGRCMKLDYCFRHWVRPKFSPVMCSLFVGLSPKRKPFLKA